MAHDELIRLAVHDVHVCIVYAGSSSLKQRGLLSVTDRAGRPVVAHNANPDYELAILDVRGRVVAVEPIGHVRDGVGCDGVTDDAQPHGPHKQRGSGHCRRSLDDGSEQVFGAGAVALRLLTWPLTHPQQGQLYKFTVPDCKLLHRPKSARQSWGTAMSSSRTATRSCPPATTAVTTPDRSRARSGVQVHPVVAVLVAVRPGTTWQFRSRAG